MQWNINMNNIQKINTELSKSLKQTIQSVNILKQSFGKSKSQWMESNMAISGQTPLRNIRHLLARIERSYEACKETEYKIKKKQVRLEIKEREHGKEKDYLEKHLKQIEIDEIKYGINSAMYYFTGAVKKIQHNYDCIKQIMESKGWKSFDEIDFEHEEEEYHIKTALNQAIRSVMNTNCIDPGNLEYLEQCGINIIYAQRAIQGWVMAENAKLGNGTPDKTTESLYKFIDQMYQDFKGLSIKRLRNLGVESGFLEKVMFEVSKEDLKLLK